MEQLGDLPNIGKVLELELKRAGIDSIETLEKLGSREAYRRLKSVRPDACINMLYSLEGAIQGIRRFYLAPEVKKSLKEFYDQLA